MIDGLSAMIQLILTQEQENAQSNLLELKAEGTVLLTDQVDGSLVEACGLQDLLHGDSLQFVGVQLLPLVRYAVVHDHRQRAHPSLFIVRSTFLEAKQRDANSATELLTLYHHYL